MAGGMVHIPCYATSVRDDLSPRGPAVRSELPRIRRDPLLRSTATARRPLQGQDHVLVQLLPTTGPRFWDGEEAIEFRARFMGKYQVPLTYVWHDEIGSEEDAPAVSHVTADMEIAS